MRVKYYSGDYYFVCSNKTERRDNTISERGVSPWCEQR